MHLPSLRPDLRFTPASDLPPDELALLWNRAYEGYFVALHFTPEMLARHVARSGAALALSRVLWAGDEPAGVSLAARRGPRAYVAGFGIAAGQRRRGLARALIGEQLRVLREAGVAQVQLEVIEQNPARQLYAAAGFAEQRRLLVLDGPLHGAAHAAEAAVALDAAALATAHQRLNATTPPTWRREWATLGDTLAQPQVGALGIVRGGEVLAYAVVQDAGDKAALHDAAAADEAAARALLGALAQQCPARVWRLVDEPEGTPLARAAQAAGLRTGLCQMEMQLRW